METLFVNKKDCSILRHPEATSHYIKHPDDAVLMDCEGNVIQYFEGVWTDEQIWAALDFANLAYNNGYHHGRRVKAREIRRSLGEALNSGDGVYRP